jgi:hypothetical protein
MVVATQTTVGCKIFVVSLMADSEITKSTKQAISVE